MCTGVYAEISVWFRYHRRSVASIILGRCVFVKVMIDIYCSLLHLQKVFFTNRSKEFDYYYRKLETHLWNYFACE